MTAARRDERGRDGRGDAPPDMFGNAVDAAGNVEDVGHVSLRGALGATIRVATQGRAVAEKGVGLAVEAVRIGVGRSAVAPAPNDWRFKHPAWSENPVYRRVAQLYLAGAGAATDLVEEFRTKDWRTAEQARFAVGIATSAVAPTNFLPGNPAALERAFETGGATLVRGARNLVHDVRHNRGMPSQVDTTPFTVGGNLAATPGAVVFRNELCEVIAYTPTTAAVRERPVLTVPPPIGKYYFLDLAPGKSMFEYAVSRGIQVFTISWRNPRPEQGEWNFDTYGGAMLEALDVARDVSGSPDVNLLGFCAGGIMLSTVLSHLAAQGDERVHSASFGVMLLDFDIPAMVGAFSPKLLLRTARAGSARKGVLPAKDLAAVFAWMRPNDLVWNYWVNNYLLGQKPPANDIMAWNVDGTNLPAALHAQFLDIFGTNALSEPERLAVLGTPVDLRRITYDTYVMGALNDHLTPWRGCYRATQLIGGRSTFVLSNAGHIAGLVNPPSNPKAKFFAGPEPGPDPDAWLAEATERRGSWWEHWADWMIERSGEERPAPRKAGSRRHPALGPAPGAYVCG